MLICFKVSLMLFSAKRRSKVSIQQLTNSENGVSDTTMLIRLSEKINGKLERSHLSYIIYFYKLQIINHSLQFIDKFIFII